MLNLMSSPGSGKTTLLEHTARALAGPIGIAVIEGDQETRLNARRISPAGCRVVQIRIGSGCHLDAAMVARGLDELDPHPGPRTSPASAPPPSLLHLSAVTGAGMPAWFGWLPRVAAARA